MQARPCLSLNRQGNCYMATPLRECRPQHHPASKIETMEFGVTKGNMAPEITVFPHSTNNPESAGHANYARTRPIGYFSASWTHAFSTTYMMWRCKGRAHDKPG